MTNPTPSTSTPSTGRPKKVTVPKVRSTKVSNGDEPLVMVTAYDAPSARIASDAGVDMILVGDSVAMVVLGYDDTLQITVDDMAHHVAAVARTKPTPLIVADMPWMSFHVSVEDTLNNAAKLIRAGGQCVKIEGGTKRVKMIQALVDAEIPVMGHLGLTPQSTHAMGGFKVQARQLEAAEQLLQDAKELQDAGVFAIVLEGIPDVVANLVTESIDIPTIGIGAGAGTDGQVLVFHDVVGLETRFVPKFVRAYANLHASATDAVAAYAHDVRNGHFPNDDETYHASAEVADSLALYGRRD
jgi:3-methyl-2-oxobutanoate hydroxymethyltransferase